MPMLWSRKHLRIWFRVLRHIAAGLKAGHMLWSGLQCIRWCCRHVIEPFTLLHGALLQLAERLGQPSDVKSPYASPTAAQTHPPADGASSARQRSAVAAPDSVAASAVAAVPSAVAAVPTGAHEGSGQSPGADPHPGSSGGSAAQGTAPPGAVRRRRGDEPTPAPDARAPQAPSQSA